MSNQNGTHPVPVKNHRQRAALLYASAVTNDLGLISQGTTTRPDDGASYVRPSSKMPAGVRGNLDTARSIDLDPEGHFKGLLQAALKDHDYARACRIAARGDAYLQDHHGDGRRVVVADSIARSDERILHYYAGVAAEHVAYDEGRPVGDIRSVRQAAGTHPRTGRRAEGPNAERDRNICQASREGKSGVELAHEFGLSEQRISQITAGHS